MDEFTLAVGALVGAGVSTLLAMTWTAIQTVRTRRNRAHLEVAHKNIPGLSSQEAEGLLLQVQRLRGEADGIEERLLEDLGRGKRA
ncbi:hypothetical protein [Pseudarthrobacter sp. MM222]|uniref:hypothetical protein n=1 Tax=Pseudarthrobacter sp. MM222 TaxID=3018929 RepID=UPI00221FF234|nr:hypothetical protein [Pseudarthrobacter sp. MM222]